MLCCAVLLCDHFHFVKDRPVPHVIWDVATGLGGVVRKKSAGDGGVSVQKYIYLLTRAL